MEKNNKFNLIFANAIVNSLWIKGLLSDEEKKKIDDKNKISFS